MPEISKEIVALLNFLLPGFLAAWVIYGLTNHEKPSQFERTIQALIFTFAIQAAVWLIKSFLFWVGKFYNFGLWGEFSNSLTAYSISLAFGFLVAKSSHDDIIFSRLRKLKITGKSSHPTEWSDVFSKFPRFVVLHLDGERRLFGWPEVWPSKPNDGHFFIVYPSWLTDAGEVKMESVEGILVSSKDVKWVEFLQEKGKFDEQEQTTV